MFSKAIMLNVGRFIASRGSIFTRSNADIKNSKSFALASVEGIIETDQVFPYPSILSEDQEELLKQMVEPTQKFFEEKNDALMNDLNETPSKECLQGIRDLGAFGLLIPEKYGGVGLTNTQYGRLGQIIGQFDLGLGIVIGAHQSIGYKGIVLFGTEEQKSKYLPKLATGEHIAAFALTEPSSGSDANSIKTRAILSPDGKHYILNGSKLWISNGGFAKVFTLFAQTPVKDKDGNVKDKVTAFIVERSFGGITHGPPEKKMGIKCSNTAALFIEDCKVPVENVLGEVGSGFKVAMNILNNGRFGMGAALGGTMRTCIAKASQFAFEREQFGLRLKDVGAIQEKLARMQVKQYVTESMAFCVAGNMDRGIEEYQTEAAISKVYSSEGAWYCCDEAIQIMGGNGFMREYGLEKIMRDLRIFRIFEGTSEILRSLLAGMCLKHLAKVSKGGSAFVTRYVKCASGMQSLSNNRKLANVVHSSLRGPSSELSKSVVLTSMIVNSCLIKYKKDIMMQSVHLLKLADCIIECYGMAVALSRATLALNKNSPTAEHEAKLATLACIFGTENVRNAITSLNTLDTKAMPNIKTISDELCQNGGTLTVNPVGF